MIDKERIQTLSAEEIARTVTGMSTEQLQSILPGFTLEQITAALGAVTQDKDPAWQAKTTLILSSIVNIRWLEAVGRVLNPQQAQAMLDYCQKVDKSQQWKLSPLVVGMSPSDFADLLTHATHSQMDLLKHEGMAEPMQFQLRTLAQEWLYAIERLCSIGTGYEQDILALNGSELDDSTYQAILKKFSSLHDNLSYLLDGINKALAITWHTNRIDLIEKFSIIKELCQKAIFMIVGHPRSPFEHPTGLYEFLERHLAEIFGHATDPDLLKDDDSPFDALGKFNIWHLEDYWEAGLLPHISHKEALHLNPSDFSEEGYENHQQKLMEEVKNKLEEMGLNNVRAFKLAGIWSPKMFKEYVSKHREPLN